MPCCETTIMHIVQVLIDTWWNVNLLNVTLTGLSEWCFNRYMVECEYFSVVSVSEVVVCFNRYMVECEFQSCMNCMS